MNSHRFLQTAIRTTSQPFSAAAIQPPIPEDQRTARRITITVPYRIHGALQERSLREGRSLSNLAAYLLERTVAADLATADRPCNLGSPRWRP